LQEELPPKKEIKTMETVEQKIEVLKTVFKTGSKFSLFRIDSCLAMTHRQDIEVVEYTEDGSPIYKEAGKRKRLIFNISRRRYSSAPVEIFDGAIFKGWNQPITCDTDDRVKGVESNGFISRQMRGNACYNFVGTPEAVKAWIDTYQLNPYFEKEKVLAIYGTKESDEAVVYPELYKGGHAVIDRMLNRQKTAV
jgi:hypothetical protein